MRLKGKLHSLWGNTTRCYTSSSQTYAFLLEFGEKDSVVMVMVLIIAAAKKSADERRGVLGMVGTEIL